MSKKPAPAVAGDKARIDLHFDKMHLLGAVFGEFDRNLVTIENRLGVYISARGNRLLIEGDAEACARARDVITGESFRAAAVTTPSVPSAPISNCFRS